MSVYNKQIGGTHYKKNENPAKQICNRKSVALSGRKCY